MEKIKAFQITGLHMEGFKSFCQPTDLTFGNPTAITGGNGRGKSTIADAIAFAVTGLPFFGERRIDRLHCEDNPNLLVSMSFVDDSCSPHTLTRTRKGNRMTINYDGYEIRQLDLNELFGERDVFLSILNPLYFIEELGEDGKNLLQRYLKQIPQEQVMAELSDATRATIGNVELLSPEGMMKSLREDIRDLEKDTIYLQGQQDLVETQSRNGTKELETLKQHCADLEAEYTALSEKQFCGMDVSSMQDRLVELSAAYSELSAESANGVTALADHIVELNRKLAQRQSDRYTPKYAEAIADASARVNALAERYKREHGILVGISKERTCPTCHRAVTEADIPAVKAAFEKTLGAIIAEGKEQRSQLEELQTLEAKTQNTFEQFKADDVAKLQSEIAEATAQRDQQRPEEYREQMEKLHGEIQSITTDLEYGNLTEPEYNRMKVCAEELRQIKAEITAAEKKTVETPEDYGAKIDVISKRIREKKDMVDALASFIAKRAELIFSQLQMNRVAISLYDIVKSTGEVKDTFKFTYAGRRYDRLSLSEKIRAGMEVSELIKRLTGRNYPVFVDNMESVDDLANVKPTGQVLMARCVANTALNVKPIRPIMVQTMQNAA